MSKQKLILNNIYVTTFIILLLFIHFVFDYMNVSLINKRILQIYILVMSVCLLSLFFTMFQKTYKLAYIIFICSFTVYIYMYNNVDEIVRERGETRCLEIGLDYNHEMGKCIDE